MLEFEPQYPRITLAVRLIAADSGDEYAEGFQQLRPGALIQRRLRAGAGPLTAFELEEVETFLAGLSREDLETLCIGEELDQLAIDAPVFVQEFLQRVFEGAADA